MDLTVFGWDDHFASLFEPHRAQGLAPARVVKQLRDRSVLMTEAGERSAGVAGRFRHVAGSRSEYPTAGDWVAAEMPAGDHAVIHAVLPRRSAFTRKTAGEQTLVQVVAANVDTVFLVTGLDGNFNVRRIERYLTTAWDSGARPVVVLNKADLRSDLDEILADVAGAALGVPVVAVSALGEAGLAPLQPYLEPRKTAALLGSSGVGKSTIINRLLGESRLSTHEVRAADSRGRHTTTHRELVALPGGALLIDTPGMRELQLWGDDEGLGRAFGDIEELAAACRFIDCRHGTEPGCAVRAAVAQGALAPERLESFLKQRRELERLALRQDEKARRQADRARGRRLAAYIEEVKRHNPKYRKG
jgi:ribosome biogenesis GTPase